MKRQQNCYDNKPISLVLVAKLFRKIEIGYDDKPICLVLVAKLFTKIDIAKLCLPKYMLLLTE